MSDREEIEEFARQCEGNAKLCSNPDLESYWLGRAALIRRIEKERDEAQTIQLARMALAFERLTILRKMWSAQEVVNWIRGDAANEMAAAVEADRTEARNKALDEAASIFTQANDALFDGKQVARIILSLKSKEPKP